MKQVVAGVDAGGTHTRCQIASLKGHALGDATGSAGAMRPGLADHAADVIVDCVRDALAKADSGDVMLTMWWSSPTPRPRSMTRSATAPGSY